MDHVSCNDINMAHSHKLLSITYSDCSKLDFPERFTKYNISDKTLKTKAKDINELFLNNNPQSLVEVQQVLTKIVEKFGHFVTHKPSLITDSKEVILWQRRLYELKQLLAHHSKVSNDTATFLEHNFDQPC